MLINTTAPSNYAQMIYELPFKNCAHMFLKPMVTWGTPILGEPPYCFVVPLLSLNVPPMGRATPLPRTVRRFFASGSSSKGVQGVQRGLTPEGTTDLVWDLYIWGPS